MTTKSSGFSLMELVIALIILGLVAAIGIPVYNGFIERGKRGSTEENIRLLKNSVQLYMFDVGGYPAKLRDLEKRPTDEKVKTKWRGPYVDPVPEEDGWGNSFVYKATPGQKRPYELYSHGPQGPGSPKEERIGEYN
jgi:general secretion pathway protein G